MCCCMFPIYGTDIASDIYIRSERTWNGGRNGQDLLKNAQYEYCGRVADSGGHCRAAFVEKGAKAADLCAVGGCDCQAFVSVFFGKFF